MTEGAAQLREIPRVASPAPLSDTEASLMNAYWRAANYLAVGQIYLREVDPLMKKPLEKANVKSRLFGHWGTCPGLSFVYTHMNRVIKRDGLQAVFVTGPGHGGPALVAHVYLEGTYTHYFPEVELNEKGMGQLLKQFSWPRGVPSHTAPFLPGSFHEGGELGYCLLHAFGAVFDHPNLLAACVVGDGEAESGPLATSWHSAKFLNPKTDGAVLPILHLNGGKISSSTLCARMPRAMLQALFVGYGYEVHVVEGNPDDTMAMHRLMAATLDKCLLEIKAIQCEARSEAGLTSPPVWPMIILISPKGWTGPKEIGGVACEGSFRAHQVPVVNPTGNPQDFKALEEWLRSYRVEELFLEDGRLREELQTLLPPKELRMGMNPVANGGLLTQNLNLPDLAPFAAPHTKPGDSDPAAMEVLAPWLAAVFKYNPTTFRMFSPDEAVSNRLSAVFESTGRQAGFCVRDAELDSPFDTKDGRVMEILSEHCCQGWLEGYLLTGRHGIFPCYEAFAQIVDSMLNQHCKWLKASMEYPWRKPVASLNYILTAHTWRQDHNGYSHQSPGFIDNAVTKPHVVNVFLPPDANTLLACTKWCLSSRQKVNLVVAGKHAMPLWLNLEAAGAHFAAGASVWDWAGTETLGSKVQVVLACCGDVPTLEVLAAADWLRRRAPQVVTRVVNIVNLMCLAQPGFHEHALSEECFNMLFAGPKVPVVMFYHGSPSTIKSLIYDRPSTALRFHVHGYIEEGSTTTPFDLTVFNKASRFHLAIDALESIAEQRGHVLDLCEFAELVRELKTKLVEHQAYIWKNGVDMPEILEWRWSNP